MWHREANSFAHLLVCLCLNVGFLGLGMPETVPELGSDLNLALAAVPTSIWWTALYPGLAMFVLVLGLSFLGEGLEAWVSSTGRDAAN